jgi:hypothetical protein
MTITKQVEDLFTGEMKEVTEPGPITLAYTTKMTEYLEAADEYMNLLIDAQSARGMTQRPLVEWRPLPTSLVSA